MSCFILCLLIDIIVRNTIEKFIFKEVDKYLTRIDEKLNILFVDNISV